MEPRNKTDYIVVHCAATKPSMDIGADTIRDWHVNGNGWRDIGYHLVIKRNGDVEKVVTLMILAHTLPDTILKVLVCAWWVAWLKIILLKIILLHNNGLVY